jgi:hypothetical protein
VEEWSRGAVERRRKNVKMAPWLYAGRLKTINSRIVLYRFGDLGHRIRDLEDRTRYLRHQFRYLAQDVGHRVGKKYTLEIPKPKCC